MSDPVKENDARNIWRDQPEEKRPVKLEQIVNSRTEALYSSTRLEIMMSIGAALVLLGMVAWRLDGLAHEGVLAAGLAAVVLWIAISLYWFRHRIWRSAASRPDAVAMTGLDYYRIELERRRDHLRNGWLWYGPLFLACLVLVAILAGSPNVVYRPLLRVLPLIILLAAWIGFGLWRRTLQANEIQREIQEIKLLAAGEVSDHR